MTPSTIHILSGKDGTPLAQTQPGARILSIADSQKVIQLAQNASSEDDLEKLGKLVVTIFSRQDDTPISYTQS